MAVIIGIYHPPFDIISGIVQTTEDYGEIPATLIGRGFQQTVDILQEYVFGRTVLDDMVELPPENAFLTYDSSRMG